MELETIDVDEVVARLEKLSDDLEQLNGSTNTLQNDFVNSVISLRDALTKLEIQ